jgi:demethylmenaquinone methyltransferase/2-methoxy-6-polyprenyl-1,4-benzoquinol methylase
MMNRFASNIAPVNRTKRDAKRYYDRISRYYDLMAGTFERKYAQMALDMLSISQGETVLEIGIGTGHCLKSIVQLVGRSGMAYGIDISDGMLQISKQRLGNRAGLCCGDAARLPYGDGVFDAVFTSFTLELFDTPEIPIVLSEIGRVLKTGGRLGIVAMSKEGRGSPMIRIYEWLHSKWPAYFDCRPIYVEKAIIDAGFSVKNQRRANLFGLPLEILTTVKL